LEGEQLLLIDVANAHGAVILQTIWGTTADARFGHRRTEIETHPRPRPPGAPAQSARRCDDRGRRARGRRTSIDDIASSDPEPAVADHLGRIGAEQLAQRIRAYWSGLGHD
jgi:hypothetical protein